MEYFLKISVISFKLSKNQKVLYIQCSHGNDLLLDQSEIAAADRSRFTR